MNRRISDLHTEMLDLKKCQIDLMKIAITVFAAISSAIVALYEYLSPINAVKDKVVDYITTGAMLGLCTIIPLIFPYIAWIIIHKCRSLFRIASYIMFLEDNRLIPETPLNVDFSLYGYERLYHELGNDKWLTARFKDKAILNFVRNFRTYSYWKKKYLKIRNVKIGRSYIGGYYSRILRFIVYMAAPYWFLSLGLAGYYIHVVMTTLNISFISIQVLPYTVYIILMVLYGINNTILLQRYNQELREIPFSKCAHYVMWVSAYKRLTKSTSKTNQ